MAQLIMHFPQLALLLTVLFTAAVIPQSVASRRMPPTFPECPQCRPGASGSSSGQCMRDGTTITCRTRTGSRLADSSRVVNVSSERKVVFASAMSSGDVAAPEPTPRPAPRASFGGGGSASVLKPTPEPNPEPTPEPAPEPKVASCGAEGQPVCAGDDLEGREFECDFGSVGKDGMCVPYTPMPPPSDPIPEPAPEPALEPAPKPAPEPTPEPAPAQAVLPSPAPPTKPPTPTPITTRTMAGGGDNATNVDVSVGTPTPTPPPTPSPPRTPGAGGGGSARNIGGDGTLVGSLPS